MFIKNPIQSRPCLFFREHLTLLGEHPLGVPINLFNYRSDLRGRNDRRLKIGQWCQARSKDLSNLGLDPRLRRRDLRTLEPQSGVLFHDSWSRGMRLHYSYAYVNHGGRMYNALHACKSRLRTTT